MLVMTGMALPRILVRFHYQFAGLGSMSFFTLWGGSVARGLRLFVAPGDNPR